MIALQSEITVRVSKEEYDKFYEDFEGKVITKAFGKTWFISSLEIKNETVSSIGGSYYPTIGCHYLVTFRATT